MAQRTVVVASRIGLHARPAAVFSKAAGAVGVRVMIRKGAGPAVPAASILSVLTLGVDGGDEVVLEADGDGAEHALDELATLLARELDA